MGLLTIAAASTNLLNSPAMLITRQGGRLSYALAVAWCQRRVHRKAFSQNRQMKIWAWVAWRGARWVRRSMRRIRGASADSAFKFEKEDHKDLRPCDPGLSAVALVRGPRGVRGSI